MTLNMMILILVGFMVLSLMFVYKLAKRNCLRTISEIEEMLNKNIYYVDIIATSVKDQLTQVNNDLDRSNFHMNNKISNLNNELEKLRNETHG